MKIEKNNKNKNEFTFYTDGSLVELGKDNCSITGGFVQVENEEIIAQFTTQIEK